MLKVRQPVGSVVKRVLDIMAALAGLVLLAPLLLLIAAVIRLDSSGPILFWQDRVGLDGRIFRMCKLRTMVQGAERMGPAITAAADPRVTRVGAFLRRWKLDELPQLLNVLGGSMSLVGPRPEVPQFVELYDAEQRSVLAFKPGITDPVSLDYRDEESRLAATADPLESYVEEFMGEKIRLNLLYQEGATVFTDIGVVLRTLLGLVRGRA